MLILASKPLVAPRKVRRIVFTESEVQHHHTHVTTRRVAPSGQHARSSHNHTASSCEGRSPARAGHVTQVRGVLAEQVVISTTLDPYLSLRALATYSGLSVRTLRQYLVDPAHPLPHHRVGGKVLVRRSEFDAWMAAYRRVGQADVDALVADVLRDVRGA